MRYILFLSGSVLIDTWDDAPAPHPGNNFRLGCMVFLESRLPPRPIGVQPGGELFIYDGVKEYVPNAARSDTVLLRLDFGRKK
jgi:hypothetical protein